MAMIQGEQVQDSELSTQAVIYLGPSSMSLMVAEAVRDRIRLLDFLQPVSYTHLTLPTN